MTQPRKGHGQTNIMVAFKLSLLLMAALGLSSESTQYGETTPYA